MKKKIIFFIGTFFVIYILNFFIPRIMPGDPFTAMQEMGESSSSYTTEHIEKMKSYYGLDKPLSKQFINTVKANLKGDFGESIFYKMPVKDVIMLRLPWSIFIMLSTLIISLIVGVFLALITFQHKKIDSIVYNLLSIIAEVPAYLVGVLLLFLVAAKIKVIPLSGAVTAFKEYSGTLDYIKDVFMHCLMPILSLVIITAPNFYFVARTSFKTIQSEKYIMNAKAKGLSKMCIRIKYICLNAVFPIVACFFLSVGSCIGGTLLVETVFNYPGLGLVIKDSVRYRDYGLLQGILLLSTFLVMVSSFLADIINYYLGRDNVK